jgi:hypothetical protein
MDTMLDVAVVANKTYYIFADDYDNKSGDFTLTLTLK